MSFVDDLRKQEEYENSDKPKEKYIVREVNSILNAIYNSCLYNKHQHSVTGYYSTSDKWGDDVTTKVRSNIEEACRIDARNIDVDKFREYLDYGIRKMGFVDYEIKIFPYQYKIKKYCLFIPYESIEDSSDYVVVWISLKW